MKINATGSVMIIFLFTSLALGLLLIGVVSWGNKVLRHRETSLALQNVLLTVLRTQADALERMALEARAFDSLIRGVDRESAFIHSSDRDSILQQTHELKSSLSGHKGRLTAVRSVIAEANQLTPQSLQLSTSLNPAIGVELKGGWVVDEKGSRTWVDSLWIQRDWDLATSDSRGLPPVQLVLAGVSSENPSLQSRGKIVWEGRVDGSGNSLRNGGFPRSWEETQVGAAYRPYRQSYFSAREVP